MMEKHLILFRHGKSDWDARAETDHQRPLNKRGIKAAKTMGKLLAAAEQVADVVITSSAVRARTTAEFAVESGQWNCPIQVTDDLYEATPNQVLTIIHQAPATANTLLLAGHEPTCSQIASRFIGGGTIRFPTAAMVRIDFGVETWAQVDWGSGQLIWFLQPKFFVNSNFTALK